MFANKSKSAIEFSGIVTPCKWSDCGDVLAIKICAPGEEEYNIETNGEGISLLGMLKETVHIKGELISATGEKKTVRVINIIRLGEKHEK